jgi:hypothetical protein
MPALNKVDPPAWIQSDRFEQAQRSSRPGPGAPDPHLMQPDGGSEEGENTDQDTGHEENGLSGHAALRRVSAYVRMRPYEGERMNKE